MRLNKIVLQKFPTAHQENGYSHSFKGKKGFRCQSVMRIPGEGQYINIFKKPPLALILSDFFPFASKWIPWNDSVA